MFRFTIRDLLWLMVVVAVALAIYFVRPRQPQWEYRLNYNLTTQDELNAEAVKGWEFVQVETTGGNRIFYFKRPRQARLKSN